MEEEDSIDSTRETITEISAPPISSDSSAYLMPTDRHHHLEPTFEREVRQQSLLCPLHHSHSRSIRLNKIITIIRSSDVKNNSYSSKISPVTLAVHVYST
ncbi:hypothetical protein MJO28_008704 [Puccinia striiformis f. sp. tritici]|uniref:Uncharacterized protein n=3 Tax=Puccinia striiformis TaxID=27350 RepID=A0A0L0URK1_9BASI|nr:hypothetical protein Pst134EB_016363 [Puccinia striiformis f. sp. tritici]KAI9603033.1 hypothetical protein H4Q26_002343 [Puccinia striiformis f. sp. tritici PST-130]KNE89516.1 hypothetical protein PSTG_17031 [Puccinia striiformis f. sp. tritici PST-78]POW16830.1 hypothetical protein PSTT_00949 [Puccinia striiformis]KAH9452414.1 hypothetical protein Pst134EB_016367 [Puccinia striiformis f. sp. tritici]